MKNLEKPPSVSYETTLRWAGFLTILPIYLEVFGLWQLSDNASKRGQYRREQRPDSATVLTSGIDTKRCRAF